MVREKLVHVMYLTVLQVVLKIELTILFTLTGV